MINDNYNPKYFFKLDNKIIRTAMKVDALNKYMPRILEGYPSNMGNSAELFFTHTQFANLTDYYNQSIIPIYSTLVAVKSNKHYQHFFRFFLDTFISNIQNLYEYIYQYTNEFFNLKLAVNRQQFKYLKSEQKYYRANLEKVIEKLENSDNSMERQHLKEVITFANAPDIKTVTKGNIIKQMESIYHISNIAEEFIDLISEDNILKGARNNIAHFRSYTSNFIVEQNNPYFEVKSIASNFNKIQRDDIFDIGESRNPLNRLDNEITFDEIIETADYELENLKEILDILNTFRFNFLYPNKKENATKKYYHAVGSCEACGHEMLLLPKSEFSCFHIGQIEMCSICLKRENFVLINLTPISEKYYEQTYEANYYKNQLTELSLFILVSDKNYFGHQVDLSFIYD
ncbi:hypothetical protein HB848_00240 [Listeria rocourtiae]|uniref:hypothetical protein n=1 Tax=Listeria rocourtiae TaxID=647910 RepID=UPI0016274105|nr:hypothetical protein [Listeria rocourtiae]MBC1433767.1 hypothetical protein [Listeria rocourtiae]